MVIFELTISKRTNLARWKNKVSTNNCSLTPAYDLLAMYVMVNGLTQ